jgi:hypothetical protein
LGNYPIASEQGSGGFRKRREIKDGGGGKEEGEVAVGKIPNRVGQ